MTSINAAYSSYHRIHNRNELAVAKMPSELDIFNAQDLKTTLETFNMKIKNTGTTVELNVM